MSQKQIVGYSLPGSGVDHNFLKRETKGKRDCSEFSGGAVGFSDSLGPLSTTWMLDLPQVLLYEDNDKIEKCDYFYFYMK